MKNNTVPICLQHDSSDCGLAAIKMVSDSLGVSIEYEAFRRNYLPSKNGLTLKDMIYVCHEIDLSAKAYRVNAEALKNINLPCILHWNMNHYVVLESINLDSFTIVDPSLGRRIITKNQFKKSFTGIILSCEAPERSTNNKKAKPSIGLLNNIKLINKKLLKSITSIFVIDAFLLSSPLLIKNVIDQSYQYGFNIKFLAFVIFCTFSIYLIYLLSIFVNDKHFNSNLVSALSISDNHTKNLLTKTNTFFEKRTISEINNISDYISKTNSILQSEIPKIFSYSITILFLLLMFAFLNLYLFFLALAFSLLLVGSFIKNKDEVIANNNDKLYFDGQSKLIHSDILRNIKTYKISNTLSTHIKRYLDLKNESILCDRKTERNFSLLNSKFYFYSSLARITLFSFVGYNLSTGTLANSDVLLLIIGFEIFSSRLNLLTQLIQNILVVIPHIKKSSTILEYEDNENLISTISEDIDKITISGGSYRHSIFESNILDSIDIELKKDRFYVIYGPSGSGKSTLVDILTGSNELTKGKFLINNSSNKEYISGILRGNVATIYQSDSLSTGTILENISSFEANPNVETVNEICKNLGLDDMLNKNPLGLYCFVFDGGKNFSGGERQRILLARAIYKKPKLLFLDEATSALDIKSEGIIYKYLADMKITRVVISHRKEVLDLADSTIFVEQGKVFQTFK